MEFRVRGYDVFNKDKKLVVGKINVIIQEDLEIISIFYNYR